MEPSKTIISEEKKENKAIRAKVIPTLLTNNIKINTLTSPTATNSVTLFWVASIKSLAENQNKLDDNYLKLGPKPRPVDKNKKQLDVLKAGVTKKLEFSSSLLVPSRDTPTKTLHAIQNKKKQFSGSVASSSP